jgi:hypothetical protein
MAKLETFSNLTRPQEDLLKKYYCFGSLALLNVNIVNDKFTFHTRLSERHSEHPRASAWLQFKNDLVSVKAKKRNDRFSHYRLEVTPSKLSQYLKAMFECKLLPEGGSTDASLNVEYNHERCKTKWSYLTAKNLVRLQANLGRGDYGLGLEAKLDLDSLAISEHVLAFWWFKGNSRLVTKHLGKAFDQVGDFEVSYLHGVSETATLASKVVTRWASRSTSLEVGGEYKYDGNTLLKGKVNSDGRLALALSKSVTPTLRVSAASELSASSLLTNHADTYKFGLRFDFTQ